jgi:hypothetical protein
MIKWWNHLHSSLLQSYEIEAFINHIFEDEIPSYAEAIYSVFREMTRCRHDFIWSAEPSQVALKAEAASLFAQRALESAIDGHGMQAASYYRRLFGAQFPPVGE